MERGGEVVMTRGGRRRWEAGGVVVLQIFKKKIQ
jgi:hypothetical protein